MTKHGLMAGIAIACVSLPVEAIAGPVTYDFTVTVTEGKLAGISFGGSFTYDDDAVSERGMTAIAVEDGLTVDMTFFDRPFTAKDDIDYPEFPQLFFEDGEVQKLEFWVEPGEERGSWWDLPGWNVDLERRESDVEQQGTI